jgi:hypothetical protein
MQTIKMHEKTWRVICIGVLLTILSLGLKPFHSPKNAVAWMANGAGLRFGPWGTVWGSNSVKPTNLHDAGASLEVWVQPAKMWDSGTFLTLYRREDLRQFSLRQFQTDLAIQIEPDNQHRSGTRRAQVADVFRRSTPVFITLSSNVQGALVYIDGALAQEAPGLRLSIEDLAGRVIVGDSPRQSRSWKGQFLGLAFYEQTLTAHQVLNHYKTWTNLGRPELMTDDRGIALYLFDEHKGKVVHSQIGSGDLSIPETYTVLDKICLAPLWREFEMTRDYWSAVIKNLVGFVPLGFCFYAYWSVARPLRKPALATVALGVTVSFTIEFLQCYLPTRESGTTDLITNTAGTALGILLHRLILAQSRTYMAIAGLSSV